MKGCRRVAVCLLLVLVLFHASVSPVLASNIGSEEFLKTYDPEKKYEIKPILLPPNESNAAKSQTHERNPNGSVVGSPYANIPDSELSTGEIAAKYGVSVGQAPNQSLLQKLSSFMVGIFTPIGNTFASLMNWFKGVFGKGGKPSPNSTKNASSSLIPSQTKITSKNSSTDCSKSLSRSLYDSSPNWLKWVVNNTSGAPSSECSNKGTQSATANLSKKTSALKKKSGDLLRNIGISMSSVRKDITKKWTNYKKYNDEQYQKRNKEVKAEQLRLGLIKRLTDRYGIFVHDGSAKWKTEELKWIDELLESLPPKFYYHNELKIFLREKGNNDCANYYEPNKAITVHDGEFCRMSELNADYDKNSKDTISRLNYRELNFKRVFIHELNHSYQEIRPEIVDDFANFSWEKRKVVVVPEHDGRPEQSFIRDSWLPKKDKAPEKGITKYAMTVQNSIIQPQYGERYYSIENGKPIYVGLAKEDLSESVAFYMLYPSRLKMTAPNKYNFIKEKIFNNREYQDDPLAKNGVEFNGFYYKSSK